MNTKEQWLKAKMWWENLAKREQQALAIGGCLLGIFIIYAGIWSPLVNHVADLRKRIVAEQKLLLWMQAADKRIHSIENRSPKNNKPASPVLLLSLVQKQVVEAGLDKNLTQLKQAANDAIEMHFQKVEFDKLVVLLTDIVKTQRVSISQMSTSLTDHTSGIVNADVQLKIG